MRQKLIVPTSLDDITVGQYQKICELEKKESLTGFDLDTEILKCILNFENIDGISAKDRKILLADIRKALENKGEFKQVFELNGIEFGMIPNFDKITNGEYIDLIEYYNKDQTLHNFLAVIYRPIKKKDSFGNYSIDKYKGSAIYADTMKQLPMSIYTGLNVFFWNLSKDLNLHFQKSMEAEQVKV